MDDAHFSELIGGVIQCDPHFREWIVVSSIILVSTNIMLILENDQLVSSNMFHMLAFLIVLVAQIIEKHVICDCCLPFDDAPIAENTIVRICNLLTEPCKSCIALVHSHQMRSGNCE